MSPKTINLSGKLFAIIGMLLGAVSVVIATLEPTFLGQDYHDVIIALGVFLGAFSAWLAHHFAQVG
jgi:hypothetical protein